MKPEQIYPYDGLQKFATWNVPVVAAFRLDAGAQAVGTNTLKQFHQGDVILGFVARVTEAVTSGGAGTLQLGFTGKSQLSAAVAKSTLVADYQFGPVDKGAYVLAADDTFDSIVGTADLTAGKCDIYVIYYPAVTEDLSSDVKEYVTS